MGSEHIEGVLEPDTRGYGSVLMWHTGIVRTSSQSPDRWDVFADMSGAIAHRGPDDTGFSSRVPWPLRTGAFR